MENGMTIKWFDRLDSTNSELLRHIDEYDNLSVVAAVEQFAGRGQRGNRWLSRPGDNLTFSLLLKPRDLPAAEFMSLTFMATLAVRSWLEDQGVSACIKWPNDIYVGKKKICGMLIENGISEGKITYSVIGIGLNLNQEAFPGELVNPISLKRLTGKETDSREALEDILSRFDTASLENGEHRKMLLTEYEADLFQKGRLCLYRNLLNDNEFYGTIEGVTLGGRLRVDVNGTSCSFAFKEISYIL